MTRPRSQPAVRTAFEIAKRIQCLYCDVLRGYAEVYERGPVEERGWSSLSAQQLHTAAKTLSERWGLGRVLTPREIKLQNTKLGKAKTFQARNATWRGESMTILSWAIGRLPTFEPWHRGSRLLAGRSFLPESILKDDGPLAITGHERVRPLTDLARMQRIAHLWMWRSRIHLITEYWYVSSAGAEILNRHVRKVVGKAARRKDIQPINGDLAVGSKTYHLFPKRAEQEFAWRRAPERLRAANWLLDARTSWDNLDIKLDIGTPLPRKFRTATADDFKIPLVCPADQRI